jgi:hypothetical protein
MRSRLVGFVAGVLVVGASLLSAAPAGAKGQMVRRSAENVTQAPLDLLLAPYTGPSSLIRNYYGSSRHSKLEKVMMTPVMGVIYLPACGFMSMYLPVHRFLEGMLTFPLALALAGTEQDIYLYDPVHGKKGAIVDKKGEYFNAYFGGYYCEGFFK